MAVTIFAAIDVGSYNVCMDIYQISPKSGINKIDEIRSRLEIGRDAYGKGKISYEFAQELCEVLGDFARIMKEYGWMAIGPVRPVPCRKQRMYGWYWIRFTREPVSR